MVPLISGKEGLGPISAAVVVTGVDVMIMVAWELSVDKAKVFKLKMIMEM